MFGTLVNVKGITAAHFMNFCWFFYHVCSPHKAYFLCTASPTRPCPQANKIPTKKTLPPKPQKTQINPTTPTAAWPQSMFISSHRYFLVLSWRTDDRVSWQIWSIEVNCVKENKPFPSAKKQQQKKSCQVSHWQSPTNWSFQKSKYLKK